MDPKLLMGGLLLAAGVLATVTMIQRGASRTPLLGTAVGAGAAEHTAEHTGGSPGVVQPRLGAARGSLLSSAVPSVAPTEQLGSPKHDRTTDVTAPGLDAEALAAQEAEWATRLAELEQQNQRLRFQLAQADRRLQAAAAREVTDFLGGVRTCLDDGFKAHDFLVLAGGERINLRQDVESVLFDVARQLRTQDLRELRKVADDGRIRQVIAVLDVFHRRRLVDGVEDWHGRKRQLSAIFGLALYPES